MRNRNLISPAVLILLVAGACPLVPATPPGERSKCNELEVAGLCDPYVPGTFIRYRSGQPILVVSTWHDGPAEKAGICPGDEIISINGILASENPMRRMLREIASESPSPVNLKLKRGKEEMNLDVPRVKESKLVELSKQRVLKAGGVEGGLRLVPRDQSIEELKQLEKFQERIDKVLGFKTVDGSSVPRETPDEQVEKLLALGQSDRTMGIAGYASSPESYTTGFSVSLLKDPEEVWVRSVQPGSPAHRAGLLPGDTLVELDGKSTKGLKPNDLNNLLSKPDERRLMKLTVMRAGRPSNIDIETQRLREFAQLNLNEWVPERGQLSGDDYVIGIEALHIENPRQAIVVYVEYPSPAFDAGLHVGDSIVSINGILLEAMDRQRLAKILTPAGTSETTFEVSRLGKRKTFRIVPVAYRTALASIGRKPTKLGPAPQQCREVL